MKSVLGFWLAWECSMKWPLERSMWHPNMRYSTFITDNMQSCTGKVSWWRCTLSRTKSIRPIIPQLLKAAGGHLQMMRTSRKLRNCCFIKYCTLLIVIQILLMSETCQHVFLHVILVLTAVTSEIDTFWHIVLSFVSSTCQYGLVFPENGTYLRVSSTLQATKEAVW